MKYERSVAVHSSDAVAVVQGTDPALKSKGGDEMYISDETTIPAYQADA